MPKSIAIVAPSSVPFQVGGAEKLWWGLRQALGAQPDWQAELIKIPVKENSFSEIIEAYKLFSALDLSHFDAIVTTKYPAWLISHPCHLCYMMHPLRGLYDTYHFTGLPEEPVAVPEIKDLITLINKPRPNRSDLPRFFDLCAAALASSTLPGHLFAFPGPLIRKAVHFLDKIALNPDQIHAYLAISSTVAARKDYFPPDVPVTILPHPSDITRYECRPGKYFFTASRINATKRIDLIVDAMAYVPQDIQLKIAGTGPELENLKTRTAHDSRIRFLGFVPDSELPGLYAEALAVPFCPLDEDYGLITIEAMNSGKPVITTSDSGGVCEITRHNQTGLIAEPNARSIGAAMRLLADQPDLARQMGEKARQSVASFASWEHTAQTLLSKIQTHNQTVIVAAPFAADANGAGGPRRLYHFCATLARHYQVELICYGNKTQERPEHVSSSFNMTLLPWPTEALKNAQNLATETGESCDDLALMLACGTDKTLLNELSEKGKNAFCAILSHPWLLDAITSALPDRPLAYDAHNVEADVKSTLKKYPALYGRIRECENKTCQTASVIFGCSQSDISRFTELYGQNRIQLAANGCQPQGACQDKAILRQRLAYPWARLGLFIGSGHAPNIEAALSILEIARKTPEIEYLLAGSVCTQKEVQTASRPDNVHLLGPVSEKVKNLLLACADVGLNPITSGSGSNLKIIEYLAAGLPCISTSFGMRGLPDDLDQAASVCQLEDFPDRIRQIIARPPARECLERIAERMGNDFAWSIVLRNVPKAIRQIQDSPCSF